MNLLRVYVLDDDKESAQCLSCYLKDIEHVKCVGIENDPVTAISEIISTNPDLLLLDIEMPCISGFDVVAALKAQNCNPHVAFVSGYFQYAVRAIRERAVDYLLKPVSFIELKNCIIKCQKLQSENKQKTKLVLNDIEQRIAESLFQGKTSNQIGDQLCLSPHTVDKYRCQILKKAGVKSTLELISHFTLS